MQGEISRQNALRYILAGNAIITMKNISTGNRFTYKISKLKKKYQQTNKSTDIYWVRVLTCPNNTRGYRFFGTVFVNGSVNFKVSNKSKISKDAQSVRVFHYCLYHLTKNDLSDDVKFYHEGYCGRCGRLLTVPESIVAGYGPICINLI